MIRVKKVRSKNNSLENTYAHHTKSAHQLLLTN